MLLLEWGANSLSCLRLLDGEGLGLRVCIIWRTTVVNPVDIHRRGVFRQAWPPEDQKCSRKRRKGKSTKWAVDEQEGLCLILVKSLGKGYRQVPL